MNKLYIILILTLSSLLTAQTTLKHNELSFSNGTGFSDSISEDLPIDSVPSNITYEDYLAYVYGFSVYDLGTVNVLGGSATNVIFGQWVGDPITTTVDVYSGIQGITEVGKAGSSAGAQNAFSDLQIAQAENEASVWFRSESNNKNQIDSYNSIDVAFTPVSQLPLALQGEAGHVNIQDKFYVRSSLLTPEGQVGVGTTNPQANLHVVGNVKVESLYGSVGKVVPLPYYAQVSKTLDKTKLVTCYKEEFSTSGFGTDMEALLFLSWVTSVHNIYSPGTGTAEQRKNEIIHTMFLFEGASSSIVDSSVPIAISGPASFDFHTLAVNKDFTLFLGHLLEPDTTYTVILTALLDEGADGSAAAGSYINLFHISGSLYAAPN